MADAGQDARSLMNAAMALAASQHASDHRELLQLLAREDNLYRLDSAKEYLAPPRQLRLARVMKALMDNSALSARQVLVHLTGQGEFLARSQRRLLLIQALVVVRPAPPDAVAFWDKNSQTDSPYLTVTVRALADNGTHPALRLLEARMANAEIDPELKVSWMRRPILMHRNEAPMLESCGRILRGAMSHELRPRLVEALFDYEEEWYRTEPPAPPELSAMDAHARQFAREIARQALQHIPLDAVLKAKVEFALRQL